MTDKKKWIHFNAKIVLFWFNLETLDLSGFDEFATIPLTYPLDICLMEVDRNLYAASLSLLDFQDKNRTVLKVMRKVVSGFLRTKYIDIFVNSNDYYSIAWRSNKSVARLCRNIFVWNAFGTQHGLCINGIGRIHSSRERYQKRSIWWYFRRIADFSTEKWSNYSDPVFRSAASKSRSIREISWSAVFVANI